jgi:putative FmdB family regulatory protein
MPTYTYSCNMCGHMDINQSINDNTVAICPTCKSEEFKKVFGKVGIAFKGSGFYSTDSRKSDAT